MVFVGRLIHITLVSDDEQALSLLQLEEDRGKGVKTVLMTLDRSDITTPQGHHKLSEAKETDTLRQYCKNRSVEFVGRVTGRLIHITSSL